MTERDQDPAVLDSHIHFWDPRGSISYPWLREVPPLNAPFTTDDFDAVRPANTSVVFVEAGRADEHAAAEIEWIRDEAERHPWLAGAVAHVRLEDPQSARAVIGRYADDPFVVGVRRNVQDEPSGFLADHGLREGIRLLGAAGLPFDACVREHQLPELIDLVAACPDTTIVLDHLGKPTSATRHRPWRQALARLAGHGNVVAKLSGLATELSVSTPRTKVISLLRDALEVFGPERCLYGSDWPVMTQVTSYEDWLGLVREALTGYPAATAEAVLRTNAERVYQVHAASSPDTRPRAKA